MTFTDWLAIYAAILGTLGFVLSVILGIRELTREKRMLKVYVEYNLWETRINLRIVNTGHRSITVKRIFARYYRIIEGKKKPNLYGGSRHSFEAEDIEKLPVTLNDGEQFNVQFLKGLNDWILEEGNLVDVTVFDAEEHAFRQQGGILIHKDRPF